MYIYININNNNSKLSEKKTGDSDYINLTTFTIFFF